VPYKKVFCSDDVVGIAWKNKEMKVGNERNKYFIYCKNGYIEEKLYVERDQFIMDFSARGAICMSSKDKKKLHAISFFETGMSYDQMNRGKHFLEREGLNVKASEYQEEGPMFIDI
jgi:hypothetical protein